MTKRWAIIPLFPVYKNDGSVAASCRVYTYDSGTNTPHNSYSNSAGSGGAAYQTLDSNGRGNVWLDDGVAYRLTIKDSTGSSTLVGPVDNVYGSTYPPSTPSSNTVAVSAFQKQNQPGVIGWDINGVPTLITTAYPFSINSSNQLGASAALDGRVLLSATIHSSGGGPFNFDNTYITSTYKTYEIWVCGGQNTFIALSADNGGAVANGTNYTGIQQCMSGTFGSTFTNLCAVDTGLAGNTGVRIRGYDLNNSAVGEFTDTLAMTYGKHHWSKIRILNPSDATKKTTIIIDNVAQPLLKTSNYFGNTRKIVYFNTARADNYVRIAASGATATVSIYLFGIKDS